MVHEGPEGIDNEPGGDLQAAVKQLYEAARADQDAAVAEALREAAERQAVAVDQAAVLARAEGRAQGRKEGRDELDRLADAIRKIDAAHSLSLILDALVAGARREALAVALMVVNGAHLRTWRLAGFDKLDEAEAFVVPVADTGVIEAAIRDQRVARASSDEDLAVPAFTLPSKAGRLIVAVPILVSGQVVAVLYGEEPANDRQAWPVAFEIMARHASRALEVTTAFRTAGLTAAGIVDFRLQNAE